MSDFRFQNHGNITLLTPLTEDAHRWVEEHISTERTEWAGGIVIEPRYVAPILEHIAADGMVIA